MTLRRRLMAAFILAAALAAAALTGGACSDPLETERIVFMAGFKPQANLPFAAAYVAQEKGYFADQDLEVEILHASTGEHLKLLMAGDVDFTTASAASVLSRRSDPDLPIYAIALFGQASQQAFIALRDSGIESPEDWEGKTFGYKISQPPEYLAILEANGVDRSKIREVRVGFDPRVLTDGEVDVLAVFDSNEPDTVRRTLGFEVNQWQASDYGLPSMGLTYITRRELGEQEPEKVERFLKATLKALDYIAENPEESVDVVLKYAPNEEREHQLFMLETELADAVSEVTRSRGLGWMTDAQWKAFYDQFIKFDALPKAFDYRTAYTDRFLEAVYDGDKLVWP